MKKLILTSALCGLSALAAFGQGSISIANNSTPSLDRHPVYSPQTDGTTVNAGAWGGTLPETVMIVGQSTLGSPSGTTVYEGTLVQSGYDFALFAGAVGAGSNNLTLVTTLQFRTSASGGLPAGTIVTTPGSVAGVAANSSADYQIVAWNNEGNTVTTWAAALLKWQGGDTAEQIGWSPVTTTSSVLASGSEVPPITDFTTFSLIGQVAGSTPEPGTLALGGLGALGLLFFRRRK